MMEKFFSVRVQAEFSAAHHIKGYDGDCARPHGHNFKVEVEAKVHSLNSIGIALDFKDLKRELKRLIDRLDHQDLNTLPPFDRINPTAEALSQYFFEDLDAYFRTQKSENGFQLMRVFVWENDRSCASFGF